MIKIFISYRRADSRKDAGRIYDRLVGAFGKENIFKDVDDIKFGDFRGILREAVAKCDVELVIIGKQWLTIKDADGNRRLDNAGDFVRIEVESGLQRDKCLVVPVLVDNAPMPSAGDLPDDLRQLAFQNAYTVRDDPDFHGDVGKLIRDLKAEYSITDEKSPAERKVQAPTFNVRTAIADFYTAFDNNELDRAREILSEIRASDNVPRLFDVDAHEQEIWKAKERADRDAEYDLLRMMAKRGSKQRTWEALQIFWEDFPDYDPDGIGERVKPAKSQRVVAQTQPAEPQTDLEASAEQIRSIIGEPFEWCEVPAGDFIYGDDNERYAAPRQNIALPAFAMAKYPITYNQYEVFVKASDGLNDRRWWEGLAQTKPYLGDQEWKIENHPRVNVNWYDALALCRWLSWKLGGGYAVDDISSWLVRLPTEFEWEKAARGTDGREYPYGNDFDKTKGNTKESGIKQTTPVTQYPQGVSLYGVFDMSGNVWEWCLTDYKNPQQDARKENINSASSRVLRGGSFVDYDYNARAAYRFQDYPSSTVNGIGFRLLRSPSL